MSNEKNSTPIYHRGPAWWAVYAAHVRASPFSGVHSGAVKAADELVGDRSGSSAVEEIAEQLRQRDIRIAELGAENATLREDLSAAGERVKELLTTADEMAVELEEARTNVGLAIQQGQQALADLRAEHEHTLSQAAEAVGEIQDNMSEMQRLGRHASLGVTIGDAIGAAVNGARR